MSNRLVLVLVLAAGCGTVSNDPSPDGAACVAETDAELCARLGAACDAITDADNCGATRTASCGTCSGSDVCTANTCTPPAAAVCSDTTFTQSSVLTALSDNTMQDAVLGVSADMGTILSQRSFFCSAGFSLILADDVTSNPQVRDISGIQGLQNMQLLTEGTLALSADGLTIIGIDTTGQSVIASKRSAIGQLDFSNATAGTFGQLAVTGARQLAFPTLSADGLAFYYLVHGDPDPNVNGMYESLRSSAAAAFPSGTRMPALVQDLGVVTGISSDRRTLFLQTASFTTVVLSRASITQPFSNSNAPDGAPIVPGFRVRPVGDCSKLVATCTPGGCTGEEVCVITH